MPNIDPLTYIKTVLAKDFAERALRRQQATHHDALVITLSRDYGAVGEDIARGLSLSLNIPVHDQEVLDLVAKKAKTDKYYFQAHDEQSSSGLSAFLYSLVSGNAATMQEYRRHLGDALVELARNDCIIIGRGAHLVLTGPRVFRIRVVGSKSVCAQRVALALNITPADAELRVAETNHKRNKSVMDMYGELVERCSLEHADLFDLVINTDLIPVNAARDVVLAALRGLGHIPEATGSAL
ncbi:MAG: AAA family ATPase [Candidatus Methylumidiphilus sp.]